MYRYFLLNTILISASRLVHVAESSLYKKSTYNKTDTYIVNNSVTFKGSAVGDSRTIHSNPRQSEHATYIGESNTSKAKWNSVYKFDTTTVTGFGNKRVNKVDVTNNSSKENFVDKADVMEYPVRGSKRKPNHKRTKINLNLIACKINGLRLSWTRKIWIFEKKGKKWKDRGIDWRRVNGGDVRKRPIPSYNCHFLSSSNRRNAKVDQVNKGYEKYTSNIIIWSDEAKIASPRGVTKTFEWAGEQNEARNTVTDDNIKAKHDFFIYFLTKNKLICRVARVEKSFVQPIKIGTVIQISNVQSNIVASMIHNVIIPRYPDIGTVCVHIFKYGLLFPKANIQRYKKINRREVKEVFHLIQNRDWSNKSTTLLSLLISGHFMINSTIGQKQVAKVTLKKQLYIQPEEPSGTTARVTSATPDKNGHKNIPGSNLPLASPVHSVVSAEIKKVTNSQHCPCVRSQHKSIPLAEQYGQMSGSDNSQLVDEMPTSSIRVTNRGVDLKHINAPRSPLCMENLPCSSSLDATLKNKILSLLRDNIGANNCIVQQIERMLLTKSDVKQDTETEGRIRLRRSQERIQVRLVVLMPFELDRLFNNKRVFGAIELAIQKVVEDEIIPHIQLEPIFDDSKCSISDAMNVAIEFYARKSVDVFIGPVCDYAVAPIARQVRYWNIPIISPGAMAVDFSFQKETMFSLLTKIGPHMKSFFQPFLYLLNQYNWNKVKLIYMRFDLTEQFDTFCHLDAEVVNYSFMGLST